jgi:hypothetical protein
MDISSTSEDSVEEDLAAELQKSISNVFTETHDNFTELQKEFKLLETCSTKTKNLEKKIPSALDTIQPTSTSSERTFSGFSTKVRNSLQYKLSLVNHVTVHV